MPRTPSTPFVPPLPSEFQSTPNPEPAHLPVPGPYGAMPPWATPAVHPGQMLQPPGSYFAAPSSLPGGGVSSDWVGYNGPPPGSAWSQPPSLHPATPWGYHPAMAPMGAQTGYSAYQQPLPPTNYGMPPPMMGYGIAPAQAGFSGAPGMPGGYPTTPWRGGGEFPMTPATTTADGPFFDPTTLGRPKGEEGGFDTRFWPGKHYGPVLDPLLVAAVGATPKINPLISPPPDDPKERDYIKWNMLYTSSFAQRSSDPSHLSWSRGREDPATFPRVSSMRLLSRNFTWIVDIRAAHRDVGVTCGDVIDQLSEFLHMHTNQAEYDAASGATRRKVGEAYHLNRSRAYGVPGGRMGEGLLRADWLGPESMFEGIERDAEFVRARLAINSRKELPCVWVLRCTKRWIMSEEEQRDFDQRERAEERRRRSGGEFS